MALYGQTNQKRIGRLDSGMQIGQITAGNSSTVMSGSGIYFGNSLTVDNTHTKGVDRYGRYYQAITSALSGNNAGQTHGDQAFRMDQQHATYHAMSLSSVASVRVFCGQIQGTGVNFASCVDSDTLGAPGFGFQFSTPRGDTNWQFISWDGSNQTTTNTGVAAAATTLYQFEIDVLSTSAVSWKILDYTGATLASGTATATLPSATVAFLSAQAIETETTATKGLFTYLIGAASQGFKKL